MVASLREFGPVWGVDRGFDEVRKGGPWGWLGRWCPGLSRLRVGGWPGWPSRESIASDAEIADTVDGWLGRLGVVGVHHFTGPRLDAFMLSNSAKGRTLWCFCTESEPGG